MFSTTYNTPTLVISNGTVTGNQWTNVNNLLLLDGQVAESNPGAGTASDVTVGGYNFNIPAGSTINGIEIQLVGYRGSQTSPVLTVVPYFYDNVGGADTYYPYTPPFTGLTPTSATYTLGTPTYLFATTFTSDQINNMKLNIQVNGDTYLDTVMARVFYTTPATQYIDYNTLVGLFQVGDVVTGYLSGATGTIVTDNGSNEMKITAVTGVFKAGEQITGLPSGATANINAATPGLCIDCDSPIQVQEMSLYLPFLIGDTKFYLQPGSFSYADGTPVQPGDVGSCGGSIPFVFDKGKKKVAGSNFEENAMLNTNIGGWTVLPSGVIEMDLGVVTQRGLDFKTPANHVPTLMSDHDANSKVIISNNEPYNLTLIRKCQANFVFSPPIEVDANGVPVTTSLNLINFLGDGVTTVLNALHKVYVTITDHFVGATIADTTPGYLDDKLTIINGANVTVTKTILNPGANEEIQYQIASTGGGGGGITSINANTNAAQFITAGAGISVDSITTPGTTVITNTGGGGGGHVIQDNGVSLPAEPALNFVNYFTLSDNPAVATNVNINTTELGADANLGTALGNNTNLINTLTSNTTFQTLVQSFTGGKYYVDQNPAGGSYGAITGPIDGFNSTYTVSQNKYVTGTLIVMLDGLEQIQGIGNDWVELVPGSGTFQFNTPPILGSVIQVLYETGVTAGSGGGGSGFVKPKSFDITHLYNAPNYSTDIESYFGYSNPNFYFETPGKYIQKRDMSIDYPAGNTLHTAVCIGGFLYVYITAGSLFPRIYRYDINNIGAGGTQMTIAGVALGTTNNDFKFDSDGNNFYLTSQAGNSANSEIISKYSLSGTTLTWVSNTTCATVGAMDSGFSLIGGFFYGINTSNKIEKFDNTGASIFSFTYQSPIGTRSVDLINFGQILYALNNVSAYAPTSIFNAERLEFPGMTNFGGGGSSNDNTVNADETQSGWITTQLNLQDSSWSTPSIISNGIHLTNTASTFSGDIIGYNNSIWGGITFQVNNGKQVKIKALISGNGAGGGVSHNILFGIASSLPNLDPTATTDEAIDIILSDTQVFAVTTDTITNTNTVLSGITPNLTTPHLYEIVWTPQTSVKFYVDGVLKATHTTSMPSHAGGVKMYIRAGTGLTSEIFVTNPIISQEL